MYKRVWLLEVKAVMSVLLYIYGTIHDRCVGATTAGVLSASDLINLSFLVNGGEQMML